MKLRPILIVLAAALLAAPIALSADPTTGHGGAGVFTLASLPVDAADRDDANMTVMPEGTLNKLLGIPATEPEIRVAGQCGSSNYYCDTPGSTYCCGNSTDGFYCAKDVNGC